MRPRKRYRKSNREAKLNWEVNTLKGPGDAQKECLTCTGGIDYKRPASSCDTVNRGSAQVSRKHCKQSIRTGIEVKVIGRGNHSRE